MGTLNKVTTTSYENIGRAGTRQDNEMTAIDGIILSTPEFQDTIANIALEATWITGIKAGYVFPITGLDSYEPQDSEDKIYEAASGNRKLTKRGKSRYMFSLDVPLKTCQKLQSLNNGDLRLWIIRDGKICFYNNNGTAQGFSTNMVNVGRLSEVPADGASPALLPLYIDLANHREWNVQGAFVEPTSWEALNLEGLIDVTVVRVGAASATAPVIRVYAQDGFDSAGAAKMVGIKGLVAEDFVASSGTITTVTDNNDGTYTFSGTGLNLGTLNLKAPSVMTPTSGLLVKSAGSINLAAV